MKCWSTIAPRKRPNPGASSFMPLAMLTCSSSSELRGARHLPVSINRLMTEAPADVPPTTAPAT